MFDPSTVNEISQNAFYTYQLTSIQALLAINFHTLAAMSEFEYGPGLLPSRSLLVELQEDVVNYTKWLTTAKQAATAYRNLYINQKVSCTQETSTDADFKQVTTTTYSWKDTYNNFEERELYKFIYQEGFLLSKCWLIGEMANNADMINDKQKH